MKNKTEQILDLENKYKQICIKQDEIREYIKDYPFYDSKGISEVRKEKAIIEIKNLDNEKARLAIKLKQLLKSMTHLEL